MQHPYMSGLLASLSELGLSQQYLMLCCVTVGICVHMLEWAKEATKHLVQTDLLELYCGNGNFTVALAENFRLVP